MSNVNFVTTSVTNQADFRAELDLSQMPEVVENPSKSYKLCKLFDAGGDPLKRWYIEFYVFNIETGKLERQRYVKGFNTIKTLREKKRAAKEVMAEIDRLLVSGFVKGQKPETPEFDTQFHPRLLTLQAAYEYYHEQKKAECRASTFRGYLTTKRLLFGWMAENRIGKLLLVDWTAEHSFRFAEHLKRQTFGNKTFNNHITNMNAYFQYWLDREVIKKHPSKGIKKLKVESGHHVPFNVEQMNAIKQKALAKNEVQLYIFIHFAYYTLARPRKELRYLQVKDLRERTIFIQPENAKTAKGQHIIIPPPLEKLIGEYKLRSYPGNYYIFGKEGKPSLKPTHFNYFYLRHKSILDELGYSDIDDYDLYSWKHTGVIAMYNAGMDIKTIQAQCRHSNVSQTDKYMKDLGLFRNEEVLNNFPVL